MIFWFYIKIYHNCKKISAETLRIYDLCHCLKSVRIRSFSGPYFAAFRLNREINSVNLHIRSECEKMRTRKTPNTDTFYVVYLGHKQRKIRQSFAELIEYKCCNFTIVTVFLKICSHLLKKSTAENFIFCTKWESLANFTFAQCFRIYLKQLFFCNLAFLHGYFSFMDSQTNMKEKEHLYFYLSLPSTQKNWDMYHYA